MNEPSRSCRKNPLQPTLPSPLVSNNLPEPPVLEDLAPSTRNASYTRDPSLPSTDKPSSYVHISVDNFTGLAQEYSNSRVGNRWIRLSTNRGDITSQLSPVHLRHMTYHFPPLSKVVSHLQRAWTKSGEFSLRSFLFMS